MGPPVLLWHPAPSMDPPTNVTSRAMMRKQGTPLDEACPEYSNDVEGKYATPLSCEPSPPVNLFVFEAGALRSP